MENTMYPGGANYPASTESADTTYQDIQRLQDIISPKSAAPSPEDAAAAKKKRLIGMLVSAVAGGLMSRKSPTGGMGGAVAGAGGYAGTSMEMEAKDRAARNLTSEQDRAGREKSAELGVKLAEIRQKRGMSTDPYQHVPDKVKAWLFRGSLPDADREGFDRFVNPEKPAGADKVPAGIAEFQAIHGRAPKDADEYKRFKNAPPSAMELFYFNELPPELKSRYSAERGASGRPSGGLTPP